MARRDIDLVIRARNETTKVVNAVEAALLDLGKAYKSTSKDGGSLDSTLGRLGRTLSDFEKAVGGNPTEKLAAGLADAESAMTSLGQQTAKTRADLGKLESSMKQASAATDELESKTAELRNGTRATSAALAKTQAAYKAQNASIREAGRETNRFTSQQTAAAGRVEAASAKLDGLQANYARLAAEMDRVGPPTRAVAVEFGKTAIAVVRQEQTLVELGARLTEASARAEAARTAQARLAEEVAKTAARIAEQRTAYARANGALKDHEIAVANAGKAEADLAAQAVRTQAAISRLGTESTETAAEIERLTMSQTQAAAALSLLATKGVQQVLRSYGELRRGSQEAKQAFDEQRVATNALAREMAQVGPPTQAQAAAFAQAKTSAAGLKAEYLSLRDGAQQLQQVLRQRPSDAGGLAAQQARAAQVVQQTQQALAAARAETARMTAENGRLAASWSRTSQAATSVGGAYRRVRSDADGFNDALDRFYGSGRQSLSLMQRIRGQLLSMAAAYVGVFGAVEGLRGIVSATTEVEAATSRMLAVFGTADKAAVELDFIRRTADRLGISFGSLSKEYSTFAAGTLGTVLQGQKTRDIFVQTSEAARVLGLSTEDTGAILKALTQIASKGKVQLEELTGQLGDRLPGALQIMADGLGITTAELLKMTEEGSLGVDSLVKFADELEKRFGGALPAALRGTAAQIGFLKNALFQGAVQIGQGGFIESFNDLLNNLTEKLKSAEASTFFARLSQVLAAGADVASFLADNLTLVVAALTAVVATRAIPIITGLGGQFSALATTVSGIPASFNSYRTALAASGTAASATAGQTAALRGGLVALNTGLVTTTATATTTSVALSTRLRAAFVALLVQIRLMPAAVVLATGSMTVAGTASTVLAGGLGILRTALIAVRAAFLALWSATGVGLVVAGASLLFAEWATSADDASEAMNRHAETIDKVKNAYDKSKRSGTTWAAELKASGITAFQTLQDLEAATKRTSESFIDFYASIGRGAGGAKTFGEIRLYESAFTEVKDSVIDLTNEFEKTGDVKAYREALDELGLKTTDEDAKALIETALGLAKQFEANKAVTDGLDATLEALTGTTEGTTEATKTLKLGVEDAASALEASAAAAKDGKDALNELKEAIPGLREEMKLLQELKDLDLAYEKAKLGVMGDQRELARVNDIYGQARSAVSSEGYEKQFGAQKGTASGAQQEALVRGAIEAAKILGVSAKDLLTVVSYETAGKLRPNTPGPTTQYGQHRGLIQFGQPQAKRYDVDFNDSFKQMTTSVVDYLKDTGVKSGDGLLQIYAAINAGNARKYNASDANNGGAPGTVRDKVNNQMEGHKARAEALLKTYSGVVDEIDRTQEKEAKAAEKTKKDAEEAETKRVEYREKRNQDLAEDANKEQNGGILTRDATIEKAIFDDMNAAKAAGVVLTEAELAKRRELVGLEYDRVNAKREGNVDTTAANAALAEANALYAQQSAIRTGIAEAEKSGDTDKVAMLTEQLSTVTTALDAAMLKAREMWAAIGGDAATQAGIKLDTIAQKTDNLATKGDAVKTGWEGVDDLFASGLTNAFDSFAQAVANGEDAGEAARKAFLQFASDFLRQIAQMIIKKAIFNAIGGGEGGGPIGGFLGSIFGSVAHSGGMAGATGRTRAVSPAWFADAPRYHEGGIAGLKPGEVPSILQRGEEILTRDDSRHALNGGKSAGGAAPAAAPNIKVVNMFDAGSFMSEGLGSSEGESALMNFVRSNSSAIKGALG